MMQTTYSHDPRFSYTLYIPPGVSDKQQLPLVVLIHGLQRKVGEMFDSYKEFADHNYCVLFIPLFPEGYDYQKLIDSWTDLRYDRLLLDMIDEITIKNTNINTGKFFLHGYSAGGQFVHRFACLCSNRLLALSIGAPGSVILIDDSGNGRKERKI
ncbi:unnamed protein product [Didymodactylos carnosus]|uniref:Uncharacterized protein n=1 Tax=Didymodactylos carnosus TaxID=1234261 RepID=A0A814GQD2_9BILA|nr:unnamed protein product [Didymodactylos carnosus]CAF3771278.1 unnamed protein product [Didymodactylos carnosus]